MNENKVSRIFSKLFAVIKSVKNIVKMNVNKVSRIFLVIKMY